MGLWGHSLLALVLTLANAADVTSPSKYYGALSINKNFSPFARVAPPTTYSGLPPTTYSGEPPSSYFGLPPTTYSGVPPTTYSRVPPSSYFGLPPTTYSEVPPTFYSGVPPQYKPKAEKPKTNPIAIYPEYSPFARALPVNPKYKPRSQVPVYRKRPARLPEEIQLLLEACTVVQQRYPDVDLLDLLAAQLGGLGGRQGRALSGSMSSALVGGLTGALTGGISGALAGTLADKKTKKIKKTFRQMSSMDDDLDFMDERESSGSIRRRRPYRPSSRDSLFFA